MKRRTFLQFLGLAPAGAVAAKVERPTDAFPAMPTCDKDWQYGYAGPCGFCGKKLTYYDSKFIHKRTHIGVCLWHRDCRESDRSTREQFVGWSDG